MRTSTLLRIRFPHDIVVQLDQLAECLRRKHLRSVPRAALIRALVAIHMRDPEEEQLQVLGADPIKRGCPKGPQRRRRAR